MLKMSEFSVDTGRQTTPPLVDGVVHNVHYRVLVQWTSLIEYIFIAQNNLEFDSKEVKSPLNFRYSFLC